MQQTDIVSLFQLSTRFHTIVDSDPPVGFEVEMSRVRNLNKNILDILSGVEIPECPVCLSPILNKHWVKCPSCGADV